MAAYKEIKKRLHRFTETAMERQLRLRKEWDGLQKTQGMSGLQFEAKWEALLAEPWEGRSGAAGASKPAKVARQAGWQEPPSSCQKCLGLACSGTQ